jgi:hypothetical protein
MGRQGEGSIISLNEFINSEFFFVLTSLFRDILIVTYISRVVTKINPVAANQFVAPPMVA